MYELVYDEDGRVIDGIRTNTPTVYLYEEIHELIGRANLFDDSYYIEAQIWDRERLHEIWNNKEMIIGNPRN
jgi:hypothetical protein